MNKSDLVEILAERAKVPRKKAEAVVNLIFDSMTEALMRGDRIEIRGFGSFTTKHYNAYTGRNPRTSQPVHVSSKKLPFFKVGKELKERVNISTCIPSTGATEDTSATTKLDQVCSTNGNER